MPGCKGFESLKERLAELQDGRAVKQALEQCLSELLDAGAKECVLFHFGWKYKVSPFDNETVTVEEVKYVLYEYFGAGASLLISKFEEKYAQIMATARIV